MTSRQQETKSVMPKAVCKEVPEISGLYYCPNFLSNEQVANIKNDLKNSTKWTGVTANPQSRKVIQYGYNYSYGGGPLETTDPIPPLYSLFDDLGSVDPELHKVLADWHPNQLIINRYIPGQGISAHTDHVRQFGPIVVCITVGSGIEMEFTKGTEKINFYVEPNSLYIMSGDARYKWRHAILPRKTDTVKGKTIQRGIRDSLTYRTTF